MFLKLKLLAALALLLVGATATYTGTIINQESSEGAAVIDAIKTTPTTKVVKNSGVDTYSVVKHLGNEINTTASGGNETKLKNQISLREDFMMGLAKTDPALFLSSTLPQTLKNRIPQPFKNEIETDASVTGELQVIQYDDFENEKNSKLNYYLQTPTEKLQFFPTRSINSRSGSTLEIDGARLGDIIVADNANVRELVPPPSPESLGEQKTLALLINFTDSGPAPVAPSAVRDMLFNGVVQKFYQEQSYGKVTFTGDVSGWHTLPRTCTEGIWPGLSSWNEISNVLSQSIYDIGRYDRLLIIVHTNPEAGCLTEGGFASLGKMNILLAGETRNVSVAWIGASHKSVNTQWTGGVAGTHPFTWSKFNFVTAHELGHNLGVMHAGGWDCGREVINGQCEHVEYGNIFDAMGRGFSGLHFNSFYKEQLGWIPAQNILTITESGRYTISNLENTSTNSGINKFAKIQMRGTGATPFYVEWKNAYGFNSILGNNQLLPNLDGLFINHIVEPPAGSVYSSPFSRLLDMQPTDASWDRDVYRSVLGRGVMFRDDRRGITIGHIKFNPDKTAFFDVRITDPVCVTGRPLVGNVSNTSPVAVGSGGSFIVWYGNGDSVSCGASTFNIEHNIPSSWQPRMTPPGDVTITPNDYGLIEDRKLIEFTVPANTLPGNYPIAYTVVNMSRNERTSGIVNFEIVQPPTIASLTPNVGQPRSEIVVTGANFSPLMDVIIYGNSGYFRYSGVQASGGRLTFLVPDQIIRFGCLANPTSCFIPTPIGTYNISVGSNNIFSSPSTLQVRAQIDLPINLQNPNEEEVTVQNSTNQEVETSNRGDIPQQSAKKKVNIYSYPSAQSEDTY